MITFDVSDIVTLETSKYFNKYYLKNYTYICL